MPETWPSLLESVGAFNPPDDLRQRVEQRRSHEAPASARRHRRVSRLVIGTIAATVGLAAVVLILALAAHSHRAPDLRAAVSPAKAVAIAKGDGFTQVTLSPHPPSYLCTRTFELGPANPTGQYRSYVRPTYEMRFTDPSIPHTILDVVVFPTARTASACQRAGLFHDEHLGPNFTAEKFKLIDGTTVDIGPRGPNTPGNLPGQTGTFDTYLARGRVFATGAAYNERDSAVVRGDLAKIAAQITG